VRQWVVRTPEGDLLVTVFLTAGGNITGVEVVPRLDATRWGRPLPVTEVPVEGD
jgi:hypothetical protein